MSSRVWGFQAFHRAKGRQRDCFSFRHTNILSEGILWILLHKRSPVAACRKELAHKGRPLVSELLPEFVAIRGLALASPVDVFVAIPPGLPLWPCVSCGRNLSLPSRCIFALLLVG